MTNCVVESDAALSHSVRVLNTNELLARLERKGVRNVDMAKALGLPDSRIPEIRDKRRALKLEEAVKLVEAFGLESAPAAPQPLPPQLARLAVQYLAVALGKKLDPDAPAVSELAEELSAFSAFLADPKVQGTVEAAEGFFRGMRHRQAALPQAATPSKKDRDHVQ